MWTILTEGHTQHLSLSTAGVRLGPSQPSGHIKLFSMASYLCHPKEASKFS